MVLICLLFDRNFNLTPFSRSRAQLVASAAVCAALYAIVNALTSFVSTPFGVGEFRPGVIIPAFFALVAGPIPAAFGAGVGSFIGDMFTLVPEGKSTFLWAVGAGGIGNFVGFLVLGWVYEKLRAWKGFVLGTTAGLFIGNVIASAGVVLLGMFFLPTTAINPFPGMQIGLASGFFIGLLLFWFGTMFPFVIVFVPPILKYLKPYANQLSGTGNYPEIASPSRKIVMSWSIVVALLVLGAMVVALFSGFAGIEDIVGAYGGSLAWAGLFIVSAIVVIIVGAFVPKKSLKPVTQQA